MDPRKTESLAVFRDELLAGYLRRVRSGSRFEYTSEFLARNEEPIARHLPIQREPHETHGMANLHPYFAGILPEGVMLDLVIRNIRASRDDMFSILAASGSDAIGDVTVRDESGPPSELFAPSLEEVDFGAIVSLASAEKVRAIPGVQPKLSIGSLMRKHRVSTQKRSYIAKAEPRDLPGLVENEAFFMKAAAHAGIPTAQVQIRAGCLVVTRFDRVYDPVRKRLAQIHVEDMLQLLNEYPYAKYSFDYSHLISQAWEVAESKTVIFRMLMLYAFSYLVGNGDLHAKNVSLIYNRQQGKWEFAPAYDVLSTLPYSGEIMGADRMALALDDEKYGRFTSQDFVVQGSRYGLAPGAIEGHIRKMIASIAKWIPELKALPYSPEVVKQLEETIVQRAHQLQA